ncbi:glycosyltransferase [Hydrogenovibrio sp. 3SP14C1]|uniref:glycosyltransferase n=1 Tax=Hydrogenovibrio sp. 3SP14C1 TaxID=3038774 RepID=UPI002417D150|nr:glycosyltransferase [Hydrogenovibrio sp. 3SP14C1]MDG4812240.1 glycosyltransferase [Hydrogenovibrio sp. 3SP14C1]
MTKKLRILQVVGDPVGGIRKHIHDILNRLNVEFDFFYISSKKGDSIYYDEIDAIKQKIINHQTLNILKKPSKSDLTNIYKIYKFIKKYQIDLVHGHGAKGGLYARIAGKLAGCKVIYTPHGGVVHSMFKPVEAKVYKLVEKTLCYFTDLIIFESNYTAEEFKRKFVCGSVETFVNYNGVELPEVFTEKRKCIKSIPKKLGVFAMLRTEKGQHLAFQAVKELLQEGELLELHFFGDGELRSTFEKDAGESMMKERFFFHGEVTNVYEHMTNMDFVLIPSLFESFGYVAVEAMMVGVPVISSNTGGLKEVVNSKRGFIFEPDDIEDMKSAIRVAITSSSKIQQEMILKAKRHALELFSLDRMSKQLGGLYMNLLEKEYIR